MADPTNIPFAMGSQNYGVPMTSSMQSALTTALQGGAHTASFFQNQNVGNNFYSWLSTQAGQNAWIESSDETTGLPVYFAAQESGSNTQYMTVASQLDQQALDSGTPSGSFTWDGQTYNVVGTLTMTVGYNTAPQWYFEAPLAVAETFPFVKLGGLAWSSLLKPVLLRTVNGVKSCFAGRSTVKSGGDIGELGESAGEEIAGDSIKVSEDLTIDLAVGLGALGGIAVLAGLPILLEALSHSTTHSLQIYNLSPYNLTWSLACIPHGALNLAPTTSSTSEQYDYVIGPMTSYGPPGVTPVTCATNAQFGFVSGSGYSGVAYVLTFTVTDPTSGRTVDTFNVMFDVPYSGDNSVSLSSGVLSSAETWYEQQEGVNTITANSVTGNALTVSATYDYLSGEHPGPSGEDQYIYNSLLVFQPKA